MPLQTLTHHASQFPLNENLVELTNGSFVFVNFDYENSGTDTSPITFSILGRNGNVTTANIEVGRSERFNSYIRDLEVTAMDRGKFLVTWHEDGDLKTRLYNKKGVAISDVDTLENVGFREFDTIKLANGKVLIAGSIDYGGSTTSSNPLNGYIINKKGKILNDSIDLLPDFGAYEDRSGTDNPFRLIELSEDRIGLLYVTGGRDESDSVYLKIFDSSMNPIGANAKISGISADNVGRLDAQLDDDGNIVLLYTLHSKDGFADTTEVIAGVYNELGVPLEIPTEVVPGFSPSFSGSEFSGFNFTDDQFSLDLEFLPAAGQGGYIVGFNREVSGGLDAISYNLYSSKGVQIGKTIDLYIGDNTEFTELPRVHFLDIAVNSKGVGIAVFETEILTEKVDSQGYPIRETTVVSQKFWTPDTIRVGNISSNRIDGDGLDDAIAGRSGNDVLSGLGGIDLLDGGTGKDALFGGKGKDILLGGDGNDRLYGQTGNDVLDGGAGIDKLIGGRGADVFVFDGDNFGRDIIRDFKVGVDKIDLSKAVAASFEHSFDDSYFELEQVKKNVLIKLGRDVFDGDVYQEILVKSVKVADFTADDFLF